MEISSMSVPEPSKITVPWANTGLKNAIPPAANPVTGNAGYDLGFPAINMTAKEAGGIPPFGQDFNGILFSITEVLRYMQAGGRPTFNAAMATEIGGYPKGAVVISDDGNTIYRNTTDSNSTNPNTGGAGWVNEQATETVLGMLKITTQAQIEAGTNDAVAVTPKKLRFGFSASLFSNGYITFPRWLGGVILQWGVTTTTGTSQEITFPLAFPGSVFGVLINPQQNAGTATVFANWQPVSNSKFRANFSNSGFTINYFAIGN